MTVFFLPTLENDPLPYRDIYYHSELGIIREHWYDENCYRDLLIMNHDYNYYVDGFNLTYGYSLEAGLIFSGAFFGDSQYGNPWVWHIVPNN